MDCSPADSLIQAMEDGGVGVADLHVLCGLPASRQFYEVGGG